MRFACSHLETHVSHACNLRCSNCAHYSNYRFSGHMTLEEAEEWFGSWGARLRPDIFWLLGGEPTLNPDLPAVIDKAREHFPYSELRLVTNGWFLHRHKGLPELLQRYNMRLDWSIHCTDDPQYQAKLDKVRELLEDWQKRWSFQLVVRDSYARWRRHYLLNKDDMRPFSGESEEAAWAVCTSKGCINLHEGKLWKCPNVAYFPMVAAKFDIDREAWKLWLEYQPLELSCTDDELKKFFAKEPSPICALCPSKVQHFRGRSPLTEQVARQPKLGG